MILTILRFSFLFGIINWCHSNMVTLIPHHSLATPLQKTVIVCGDVETVKFLMLPLPASLEVLCFRVRFRFLTFGIFLPPLPAPDRISRFRIRFLFQSLSLKCFRFRKNLTASASTSLLSVKQLIVFSVKKRQVYFVSYFIWLVWSTGHGMESKTIFPCSIPAIFLYSISIPY